MTLTGDTTRQEIGNFPSLCGAFYVHCMNRATRTIVEDRREGSLSRIGTELLKSNYFQRSLTSVLLVLRKINIQKGFEHKALHQKILLDFEEGACFTVNGETRFSLSDDLKDELQTNPSFRQAVIKKIDTVFELDDVKAADIHLSSPLVTSLCA